MGDHGEAKPKKDKEVFLNRETVINKLRNRQKAAKPSPLIQLKEILEEATDKGRFVGDTMFWKFFEDIDIDRIYHTDSVEYRNLRVMFWETLFYVLMMVMFTVYVYQLQSRDSYDAREEQASYWSGCTSGDQCSIREVDSVSTFWRWMENELVPRAYTAYSVSTPVVARIMTTFANNDFPITFSPRFVGAQMSNVILGAVRVRQLRVKKNEGCTVSKLASHVFPDCHAAYSSDIRSTVDFAPRFGPTYLKSAFKWSGENVTRQIPISGTLGVYGGDGFVADLPFNRSDSAVMIRDLWNSKWVDSGTRAVVIELSVLNTNVNVIVNSRILFEFGPAGSVIGKVDSNAARVLFFTPATKAGPALNVFLLQIVLLILFTVFTMYVFWLMYKTCNNFLGENPMKFLTKAKCTQKVSILWSTVFHYFRYGWNFVDLVIITFFYTHVAFRCMTYATKGSESALAPDVIGHPEVFMPFAKVMQPLVLGNNILSLLALAIWVKTFKYLCMSSYFRLIVRLIEKCAARLVVFSILLVVVFFGFAVAFFMGFGGTVQSFSTMTGSFLVLFFLLMDGFKVQDQWFDPGQDSWMPVMFVVYIASIYFVMLNIFVAVLLDVYATSNLGDREKVNDSTRKNPMMVFIKTYYNWMKGLSLVKDDAEEFLKTEDLDISLELLPGIVRRKWIEKKRRLHKIASDAFAGMELYPDDPTVMPEKQDGTLALPNTTQSLMGSSKGMDRPAPIYEVPQAAMAQQVSKDQLQRLMDEDESLPMLLGSKRAVDVIRRFKAESEAFEESDVDGMNPAKKLQQTVFSKVDRLEQVKFGDEDESEVPHIPEISEITEAMSQSIGEVRNEFRAQLTLIIEATAGLFEHMVDVTQAMDSVRRNVASVVEQVQENNMYNDGGHSSLRSEDS
jgi:hypothetical protein